MSGGTSADGPREVSSRSLRILPAWRQMRSGALGDPPIPDEVGRTPEGRPVGISPASCRRAGALVAAPCTPG